MGLVLETWQPSINGCMLTTEEVINTKKIRI